MSAPADQFDEIRRKWIARHQHTFTFQKRRAEILARRIRDRAQAESGARVDPADDDVIHPFLMRPITTPYAGLDGLIVLCAALTAPLGWTAGRFAYTAITRLIPRHLRSFPVAALMWAAVVTGLPLPLLYHPGDTLTATVLIPWLLAQIPATALAVGLYGIMEGWLAVDGARDWWPMRPPAHVAAVDFGLSPDDRTLPGVFRTQSGPPLGERTPITRDS
ncbi:hypothetical protein [Mycolicibacterium septicum]|uniref:hypothetical protein n=1 Tax=Mycolicibacterium septicum TaxID=98668 RepID=UPI00235E64E6|nr:hypothetical protein [Mycolicibacterium septicum]